MTTILLGASGILFFVSLWIVVPAPTMALLALGVGAPELSPWLLVASVLVCAVAWNAGGGSPHRTAAFMAAASAILYALPLLRVPSAIRRFDEAMSVLGDGRAPTAPGGSAARRMRQQPLSVRDLIVGIDTGDARVVRGIALGTPDSGPLTMDVYRPMSPGRFPILVQIYGGAWQRGAPGDNAVFAKYFAARGYVVCAIDYRHAPRWQWPAQIDDVRAALAWIRAHAGEFDGDISRLAVVGRSAGAQLALLAAYDERMPHVAAVVSYYGPTDLIGGWRVPPRPDPLPIRPVLEAYLGGTPDSMPERYRDASPAMHLSAGVPPTLLVYGTRDHIVEARFGRELHARLRAAGAMSVLLEIPWAEHAFDALPSGVSGQISLYYTERFLAWALGT